MVCAALRSQRLAALMRPRPARGCKFRRSEFRDRKSFSSATIYGGSFYTRRASLLWRAFFVSSAEQPERGVNVSPAASLTHNRLYSRRLPLSLQMGCNLLVCWRSTQTEPIGATHTNHGSTLIRRLTKCAPNTQTKRFGMSATRNKLSFWSGSRTSFSRDG